jgi:toxin ParE1/3/4
MVKIVWASRAIKDIHEIAEFIAKDSLQYTKEQVKSFFTEVTILERQPHVGRMVPELGSLPFVRSFAGIIESFMKY